jgi:UV DNA damage endonuclease
LKIGYPCINRRIGCTTNRTFRLNNYTPEKLLQTVAANLACLQSTLQFNLQQGLKFFRISSDIIPFASHPICQVNWQNHFATELAQLGAFIRQHNMRVSMHPDQFVLLNSPNPKVYESSLAELLYHQNFLDALGVDYSAKIQIHVGGIYGDKIAAIQRFIENYRHLPAELRQRLVIENDERLYSAADCLQIHSATDVPILFDYFHHRCLNQGEKLQLLLNAVFQTWQAADGLPIVDYSSQQPGERLGKHAATLDADDFSQFLTATRVFDFDIMLEIKDKERSALQALEIAQRVRPDLFN